VITRKQESVIETVEHDAERDAAFRWVSEMTHRYVIPNCVDPVEAEAAFEFFANSTFTDHRVRFLLTLDAIRRRINLAGARIAETGHMSGLSYWLNRNGCAVEELDGDFRYEIKAPDEQYDILLSLEVLEHIKDQDHRSFDDLVLFNYSGAKAFVREMHRVIKPGGKLILTTPNACSLWIVEQAYERKAPWLHAPHVKEYAPHEVIELCQSEGFSLEAFDTFYAAHYLDPIHREQTLQSYFSDKGHSAEERGDDAFFIFARH
jgi:SAM-dependent methyltransferase